ERGGVTGLTRRSAKHLRSRAGGHSSGGAGLGLAAAFRAGQRRPLGDHSSDEPRRGERIDKFFIGQSARAGDASEHSWKNAGATRGRRRNDHTHRSVHFLDRERADKYVVKRCRGERSGGAVDELRGIATNQPRIGSHRTGHARIDSAAHHMQRTSERATYVSDATTLILRLEVECHRRERGAAGFGVAYSVSE